MKAGIVVITIVSFIVLGCATGSGVAERETVVGLGQDADYLGSGVKIAAVRLVSWEDTAYMAKAWPVKVEQEATAATLNKHKVAPAVEMPGDYATSEQWKWTPFVFESHPAVTDELVVGLVVLVAGDPLPLTEKMNFDQLRSTAWRLRKVSDTSRLFENLVEVSYYDTYFHEERPRLSHVGNVRVVENQLGEHDLRFPD